MKKKIIIGILVVFGLGFITSLSSTDTSNTSQVSNNQLEEKPNEETKSQEESKESPKEDSKAESVIPKEKPKEEQSKANSEETTAELSKSENKNGVNLEDVKNKVESIINRERHNNTVSDTILESVRVNEHMGTDSEDDVIVLVNLTWTMKNREKMTRSMLKMYSEHLSALIAEELNNDSEIALFWKAEYTGLDIKHSYYVKDGKAYIQ